MYLSGERPDQMLFFFFSFLFFFFPSFLLFSIFKRTLYCNLIAREATIRNLRARDEKFCHQNLLETEREPCDPSQFLIRVDISIGCRDTSNQSFRDIYIYETRIMNGSALGELLVYSWKWLTTPFQESYYVLLCFSSSRDCRSSG